MFRPQWSNIYSPAVGARLYRINSSGLGWLAPKTFCIMLDLQKQTIPSIVALGHVVVLGRSLAGCVFWQVGRSSKTSTFITEPTRCSTSSAPRTAGRMTTQRVSVIVWITTLIDNMSARSIQNAFRRQPHRLFCLSL